MAAKYYIVQQCLEVDDTGRRRMVTGHIDRDTGEFFVFFAREDFQVRVWQKDIVAGKSQMANAFINFRIDATSPEQAFALYDERYAQARISEEPKLEGSFNAQGMTMREPSAIVKATDRDPMLDALRKRGRFNGGN